MALTLLAAELWDLQSKIDYLEQRCAEEKKKLEKYIGAIKDDQTRMIFRLRFIHCMTWPHGRFHLFVGRVSRLESLPGVVLRRVQLR